MDSDKIKLAGKKLRERANDANYKPTGKSIVKIRLVQADHTGKTPALIEPGI